MCLGNYLFTLETLQHPTDDFPQNSPENSKLAKVLLTHLKTHGTTNALRIHRISAENAIDTPYELTTFQNATRLTLTQNFLDIIIAFRATFQDNFSEMSSLTESAYLHNLRLFYEAANGLRGTLV